MAEPRSVRWDIAALFMFTAAAFVLISIFSHDPADTVGPLAAPFHYLYQPDQIAYPENSEIQNWCGYWGALISHLLFQSIGVGAYLFVGLMFLSVVAMLRSTPITSPLGRSIGWTLVLLATATLPALLHWHFPIPCTVGPGGYLGAMVSTWINQHFALAGGLILILSGLIAGLLLSTEYAVLHALSFLTVGSVSLAGRMRPVTRSIATASLQSPNSVPSSNLSTSLNGQSDTPNRIRLQSDVDSNSASEEFLAESSGPNLRFKGKEASGGTISLESANPPRGKSLSDMATGLAKSLLGSKPSIAPTPSSTAHSTSNDAEEVEEQADETEVVEGEVEGASVREIEVDGEIVEAREDDSHALTGPRVKNKKADRNAAKKEAIASLGALDDTKLPEGTEEYVLPGIDLLTEGDEVSYEDQAIEVRRKAKILEQTFADFGLNVKVVEIETGPVIAQYEIELATGLRLSKITGLADDLAIALRVPSVRIVAPIPGKCTVGIEVPNETRQTVRLREVIEEGAAASKKMKIPLFLGKDVSGNALAVDLASLPHLLIAGRTGTGKSVCLNTIITSILMTRRPDEVRMLMIDPKMVELSGYGKLPHLMHPVVTDMRKAEAILAWAVDKMEERYSLLARAGVRHLVNYNQLGREELLERMKIETEEDASLVPDHLPFIVIVADEMADLMMTSGKEVEQHIIRLAQKSRAVGIHLILATQKPTVDVITGLIKSNLPARISFQVASRVDSMVVLDEKGADKLLGNGDMLFLWPGTSMLLRGQGTYVSDDEINRVVDHCSTGEQNFVNELVNLELDEGEEETKAKPGGLKKRDELYEAAIDIVIREGRGSCSLLQRALGIGYGRAARLIDFMAEDKIVGDYNGSQAREVIISMSDWDAMRSGGESNPGNAPKKNRIRMESVSRKPPVEVHDEGVTWDEEGENSDDSEYEVEEFEGEYGEGEDEYEYEEEDA